MSLRPITGPNRNPAGARPGRTRRFSPSAERLEARLALSGSAEPGMEIAYLGNIGPNYQGPTEVYLAGGTNPIPASVWENYTPPPGYVKNTDRNVEFDSVDFLTSPDSTTGTTYITTSDGYTWEFVTQTVSANEPFRPRDYPGQHYTSAYEAAAFNPTPPPGVVRYSANTKNAVTTWLARDDHGRPIQRYFIRDAWQNLYIMQTSGVSNDALVRRNFFSAVLPPGWVKFTGYLPRDLTTSPAYDSLGVAQYNIFRDSADDAFQQIRWSALGLGIAQQIADMPVWGGPTHDLIKASPRHDSLIHGAQGNDTIHVSCRDATVFGDSGIDTVVLPGARRQYAMFRPREDPSTVILARHDPRGGVQSLTLHDVEFLRYTNCVIPTVAPSRPPLSPPCRPHAPAIAQHRPLPWS